MQFWENLLSGRDMVTENARRWPVGLHETPKRFGKLVEYHLFDAPFFSVHGKQAQVRCQIGFEFPNVPQSFLDVGALKLA
jgi:hypothetical protein